MCPECWQGQPVSMSLHSRSTGTGYQQSRPWCALSRRFPCILRNIDAGTSDLSRESISLELARSRRRTSSPYPPPPPRRPFSPYRSFVFASSAAEIQVWPVTSQSLYVTSFGFSACVTRNDMWILSTFQIENLRVLLGELMIWTVRSGFAAKIWCHHGGLCFLDRLTIWTGVRSAIVITVMVVLS